MLTLVLTLSFTNILLGYALAIYLDCALPGFLAKRFGRKSSSIDDAVASAVRAADMEDDFEDEIPSDTAPMIDDLIQDAKPEPEKTKKEVAPSDSKPEDKKPKQEPVAEQATSEEPAAAEEAEEESGQEAAEEVAEEPEQEPASIAECVGSIDRTFQMLDGLLEQMEETATTAWKHEGSESLDSLDLQQLKQNFVEATQLAGKEADTIESVAGSSMSRVEQLIESACRSFAATAEELQTKEDSAEEDSPELTMEKARDILEKRHSAAFDLRSALTNVQWEIASSGKLDTVDGDDSDAVTGLRNWRAFFKCYEKWTTAADESKPLLLIAIDVDECRKLNGEAGPAVSDKLLAQIGVILKESIPDAAIVAKIQGQRFGIIIEGMLPNAATDMVELARGKISKTTFKTDRGEYKVTVSCAIAKGILAEGPSQLYGRLEETIREAKRYGRNRTFINEGEFPAPIVPPKLKLEDEVVELAV